MNPKEKAEELVSTFVEINEDFLDKYKSIPCALKVVDECLKCCQESMIWYWQEVKIEIENIRISIIEFWESVGNK